MKLHCKYLTIMSVIFYHIFKKGCEFEEREAMLGTENAFCGRN